MRRPPPHRHASNRAYARACWQMGRDYGIPACCRLRYCLDAWRGRRDMYLRRGRVERYGEHDGWVPCRIVHRHGWW